MRPISRLTYRVDILTRDFLVGVWPSLRGLRTPLGSLASAAVASGLCGMFLHPQGFVVFFGLLVVIILGLVWPWLSIRGLDGSLGFDRSRCREGESVQVRFVVRNRMPWGVWGVAVRGGFHSLEGGSVPDIPLAGLAFVPGWGSITAEVEFIPGCRGEYPRRPPRMACGFPFGLWAASRPLGDTATLLVWPRTVPVAGVPEGAGYLAADGRAVPDRAGQWGDPLGVRPYRRGDPLRRVHWALTARHGELIVREVQSNAVPRVLIVLDTHPAAHAESGPDGSREWAIRVAASLAEGWIGQGAEVGLVLEPGSVISRGGSVRARSATVLDALARLASRGDQDLASLLSVPESRRRDRGLRVFVTTDVGLGGLAGEGWRGAGDRFVVLRAAAFGLDGGDRPVSPARVIPWLWIDGPGRVAWCLQRTGKEVSLGC